MSGGKGGRQDTEKTMPRFAETAVQQGIGLARDVSGMGYVPYYGPDVAAFSPQQEAAFRGTDVMAEAFGMPTTGGAQYMPQAETYEGGVRGYAAAPTFEQARGELAAQRPGQAQYLESFTVDPMTGRAGARSAARQPVALEMQGGRRGK